MINKRGNVIDGFALIFIAFLFALFLGLAVYGFNIVNDVLNQDVDMGQVNLKDTTEATFGKLNSGLINNADTIGVIFLFMMCLTMVVNGYYFGSKYPKLFFIVDVFLLIFFFIPAVYVSQLYEIFINSTTILSGTYINIIPKTSKFVLNLPLIISTVGIITMIVTYAGVRNKEEELRVGSL